MAPDKDFPKVKTAVPPGTAVYSCNPSSTLWHLFPNIMKKPPTTSSPDYRQQHEESRALEWLDEIGIGFEDAKSKSEARDPKQEKAA